MQNSKGYAMMFLLGAFVAGGALGFTADRMVQNSARDGHGHENFRARIAKELRLNPTQKTAIDSLMTERHRQIVALFKPVKPQLDSINAAARVVSDSTNEQIKRLLDPSQRAAFDKMRDAARNDMDRDRRRWSGTGSTSRPDSR